MQKINWKPLLFLSSLVLGTFFGVYWVEREILLGEGEFLPWIWLVLFGVLFFNVVYLFVISVFSLFLKNQNLPELELQNYPKTALCYCIRNEDTALFYERIAASLEGNQLASLDLWILSDSDPLHEALELELLAHLKARFQHPVYYRRRTIHVERKQGNLKDFVRSHAEYAFLYVCDADSLVSDGAISKLLRKALHPANKDIGIFQSFIRIRNAHTYYARFEAIASETSQKLYFNTLQAIFGQTISFGHHLLIRSNLLAKINLPKGLLSHDNWDTALLDQMGYRVAFVSDVLSFDEAPTNYLEARKRESRWSQGTLQGWPLLAMKGLSPGVRFLSFYGIYCYLSQVLFFAWIVLGLISQSYFTGELLSFRTDAVWFNHFVNQNLYFLFWFSLAIIFCHKFVLVRSFRGLQEYIYELFASTIIYSGNFFYSTLDILSVPFKKLIWLPMKKNPFEKVSFREALRLLFPGTIAGFAGLLYLLQGTPFPKVSLIPILFSLFFGIPVALLSSKSMVKVRIVNV